MADFLKCIVHAQEMDSLFKPKNGHRNLQNIRYHNLKSMCSFAIRIDVTQSLGTRKRAIKSKIEQNMVMSKATNTYSQVMQRQKQLVGR